MRTGACCTFRECGKMRAILLTITLALVAACQQEPAESSGHSTRFVPFLGFEDTVATLSFREVTADEFEIVLQSPAGPQQTLELQGNEWRLEGALGGGAFRLDRLSSRGPREATGLYEFGDDYRWAIRPELQHDGQLLASSAYMPMADNARYDVRITNRGLIVRPLNEAATRAASIEWN